MQDFKSNEHLSVIKVIGLSSLILLTLFSAKLQARKLSAEEIYLRCYVRMTRMVPRDDDSVRAQVKNGSLSADQGCLKVFDFAKFSSSGILVSRSSEESKNVLKTFNDLHQSWFSTKAHYVSVVATSLLHDMEEGALYFTRAAFLPNEKFSSVLTHNSGLHGIRDQISYPSEYNNFLASRWGNYNTDPMFSSYNTKTNLVLAVNQISWDGTKFTSLPVRAIDIPLTNIVDVGRLVGVRNAPPIMVSNFRPIGATAEQTDLKQSLIETMGNYNVNGHLGGGIIGSQTFILNNWSIGTSVLPKEYDVINRRLTSKIFEDLLCHQMPTLTDADVQAEVIPTSKHMFQKSSSCMRCHSTMDPTAYAYRNVVSHLTAGNPSERQTVGVPILNAFSIKPVSTGPTPRTFATTTPTATVHFRELITGTKVKTSVTGVAGLGALLSQRNDLYTCAAKRYYAYFTGVNVDLTKVADKELDKYHQDIVVKLATTLKSTQSVRSMMGELFKSEPFQTSHYMQAKEVGQ